MGDQASARVSAAAGLGPRGLVEAPHACGRSERPEILEEQLQESIEDTFPASDPPAVVSTAIAAEQRRSPGTDEVPASRRADSRRPKT